MQVPEGIPASIPFQRVQELVQAFGLPLRDLISFELTMDAVHAEFMARDENGERFVGDRKRGIIATHRIAIPVVRELAQGGIIQPGRQFLIGEQGPETIL